MNNYGILTTSIERDKFELDTQYNFIEESGDYILVLKHRAWGKNRLECYFYDYNNSSAKLKAYLFFRYEKNDTVYKPKHSYLDFRYAKEGDKYKCTFQKNRNGRLNWDTAIKVE